jgi:hypothetical protein
MYGLPDNIQIELAMYMVKRYLPIFLTKKPKAIWAKTVLVQCQTESSQFLVVTFLLNLLVHEG